MSFILDALKKSEMERQRQSVPGLMDMPLRPRRVRLPKWAIALGILLVVNIGVLTAVLLKRSAPAPAPPAAAAPTQPPVRTGGLSGAPAPESARPRASAAEAVAAPASTESSAAPASADAAARAGESFSPMDAAPVYAPEIPVDQADSSSTAGARTPAGRGLAGGSAGPAQRRPDPVLTEADPPENQEVLPSINEVTLSGAHALPDLHIDVHVYATRPADRFVYINMRKYREGSVLQEGPTLERIRRDGVVLSYQGVRFLLPRQP